jgi:hypothetical protein
MFQKSYLLLIGIGVLAIVLVLGADSMLVFNLQPPIGNSSVNRIPSVNILLYEGEMADGRYGFGYAQDKLTSPGPSLKFTTADIVNITVENVGTRPHAFAITTTPTEGAAVLFNAAIGSAQNPLSPGASSSVVFAPNNAGFSYWYISPVSGDAGEGMYGAVLISTISPS